MDQMNKPQHEELARGRWRQFSLTEQMAHVGSEISRALNWRVKGNEAYSQKALLRALELLTFTLEASTKPSQLKEIARVREAVLDYFYGSNQFESSDQLWRNYFDHFAYAARH